LLEGQASEVQFSDEAVGRPDVRALMARIEVQPDESVPHTQASATALTADGTTGQTWGDHARGTLGNRLTDDELREKCHSLPDGVLGVDQAKRLADAVFGLQQSGDVDGLLQLTTPGQR
jgi:2-methylcitrate dehydratase PrpD